MATVSEVRLHLERKLKGESAAEGGNKRWLRRQDGLYEKQDRVTGLNEL